LNFNDIKDALTDYTENIRKTRTRLVEADGRCLNSEPGKPLIGYGHVIFSVISTGDLNPAIPYGETTLQLGLDCSPAFSQWDVPSRGGEAESIASALDQYTLLSLLNRELPSRKLIINDVLFDEYVQLTANPIEKPRYPDPDVNSESPIIKKCQEIARKSGGGWVDHVSHKGFLYRISDAQSIIVVCEWGSAEYDLATAFELGLAYLRRFHHGDEALEEQFITAFREYGLIKLWKPNWVNLTEEATRYAGCL